MALPSRYLSGAAQRQQLVEALSCEVHVSLGCLPGTLLERVKHVNGSGELGHVQHSMLQCRVYTDLPDAGSDNGHRFPVKRLHALLNPPELDTCKSPGVSWEHPHIAPGRGYPLKRFIRYGALYKYQYIMSTRSRDALHNYRAHLAAGLAPTFRKGCCRSPAAGDAERCAGSARTLLVRSGVESRLGAMNVNTVAHPPAHRSGGFPAAVGRRVPRRPTAPAADTPPCGRSKPRPRRRAAELPFR